MQIRCSNCHRPYALSKETVVFALNTIHEQNMNHYNAQCPHCRRVNRVSQEELLRAAPDWSPESEEETPSE
jgi:DNA-directed RNA polymerase subunit RPC12/RpoP